jgi:hypothetical protein
MEAVFLLRESLIPFEIVLGEAPVKFVEDEFGFWVHDA